MGRGADLRNAFYDCRPTLALLPNFLAFWILQTPCYLLTWLYTLLTLPFALATYHKPDDTDIIAYVEGTSIASLARVVPGSRGKRLMCVEVKGASLTVSGRVLESWTLLYDKDENRVITFTRNGADVTSREQIYATLHVYHVTAFHGKSHAGSNRLVKTLLAANYRPLLPEAAYGTLPLNWHLLYTVFSPAAANRAVNGPMLYGMPVEIESLVTDACDEIFLHQHQTAAPCAFSAVNSRFTRFLFASRGALRAAMERHVIDRELVPFETFWLHTVMHSLDHYCTHKLTQNLLFPLDTWRDGDAYQYARRIMFGEMFVAPLLNVFADNRIRALRARKPFWGDLYRALSGLDREYADQVTASIMY
ncbi:hypothetical protein KFL_000100430 [Klebsormidium nitens]|uniref:Uncharacterized protein n=1 Tax=Klebsormidium nitens TaxID=105231 RepID=A0A1Y1HR27_KLENI|nr:hypothetical protein KFL_000100430 [Klebsormidium nitens]|eukprot:GAQ78278.1 hypothetical protein KFL_000100430 [Klebsormidium nitens]